jgi:hypothetical protein
MALVQIPRLAKEDVPRGVVLADIAYWCAVLVATPTV